MDKQMEAQLQRAIEAQAEKRRAMGIGRSPVVAVADPTLAEVKRQKCGRPSKPFSPEAGNNWPPPSLAPVALQSNRDKWDAFDWSRHQALEGAKRTIVDWYNGLPGSGALVLAGDYGCGKTHIAGAIADLFGRWRISFYEEIDLVKKIQATYNGPGGKSEENIWASIFRAELLILDDLGTYRTQNGEWITNIYDRIFNDFIAVRGKPVLITTNLNITQLEARIGGRSFSRLCGAMGPAAYVDLFAIADHRVETFVARGL